MNLTSEVYLIRYIDREGIEVRPRSVSLANDVQTRIDYCNARTRATGVRAEAVPIKMPDLDGDFDGQWKKTAGSKDRKRIVSKGGKWRLVRYRDASGNETAAPRVIQARGARTYVRTYNRGTRHTGITAYISTDVVEITATPMPAAVERCKRTKQAGGQLAVI